MSHWKSFGLAIFAGACLLGETIGSAHAQCDPYCADEFAAEWRGGRVINLGSLPGTTHSYARDINDAGVVVGESEDGGSHATEWRGGRIINLGGSPGSTESSAIGINDAGQVAGVSIGIGFEDATKWSHGKVTDLGGLPGYMVSAAFGINDAGRAVGLSQGVDVVYATEWSGGRVIDLDGLPGSRIALRSPLTTPGCRWETVMPATTCTPPSGGVEGSSTWDCPAKPSASTTPGSSWE
jgi:probable HAF family extracellular repeat protein